MRKKTYIWLMIGGIFLLLAPIAKAQEEQWLQYHSAAEARQIVRDVGGPSIGLRLTSEKPHGIGLPGFKCGEPVFVRWSTVMVRSGGIWMAFDRFNSTGKQEPYDLLYIDSNADGNLADESGLNAYRQEQYSTYFGPEKVLLEGEDGPITYHLTIEFYSQRENRWAAVRPAGWYEGTVALNGQKKYCVLTDYNVNGAFNDKSLNSGDCDRIRIGEKDSRDTRFVGNYIEVSDVLYRLEVAQDGAYIKLSKAEDVIFGNIQMPESIAEFSAGGENGLFARKPEKGLCRLPVGKYRINYWSTERKDEKDAKWRIEGRSFSDSGLFDITAEKEIRLSLGEPVISTLDAKEKDSEYSFSQNLVGQLGERIELTRDGSRPQAPKLNIKSKDGTYDQTLSFAYG